VSGRRGVSPPERPWDEIKAKFLSSVGPAALGREYGIPAATIRSKASRDKWGVDRVAVATEVQRSLVERIADATLETLVGITQAHHDIWQRIIDRAGEMLTDSEVVENPFTGEACFDDDGKPVLRRIVQKPNHLRDLTAAIKAATEGQRLARGMPDPKEGSVNNANPTASGVIELPTLDPPPEPPAPANAV
jgi:hypothetical protein